MFLPLANQSTSCAASIALRSELAHERDLPSSLWFSNGNEIATEDAGRKENRRPLTTSSRVPLVLG